jgi:glycosyltransferase involved in cell wall biosynthesis
MTPTASVIIPTYNCADTILGAIESARRCMEFCGRFKGLPVDYEIAVVDDGSADNTLELVAERYRPGDGVLAIRNPENRGPGYSRNEGVRRTRGDFLFFLDADDLFLDNHMHACLSSLLSGTYYGFARTRVRLVEDIPPGWHGPIARSIPITLCVRRSSHDFIGGFNEEPVFRALRSEDVFYQNLLSVFFHCVQIPEKTVYYSRRPGNAFDRQFARFCAAPANRSDALSEEERTLAPVAQQIFERRVAWLYDRKARAGLVA